MKKVFSETPAFTWWITNFADDDAYAILQQEIMADPNRGTVIPGSGGLRKIRVPDPKRRKGKRGGARIIYAHFPDFDRILMVMGYGKDEQLDLSKDDLKVIRQLLSEFETELAQERNRIARGMRDGK